MKPPNPIQQVLRHVATVDALFSAETMREIIAHAFPVVSYITIHEKGWSSSDLIVAKYEGRAISFLEQDNTLTLALIP